MSRSMILCLLAWVVSLTGTAALGQEASKHPRVIELEAKLREDAFNFVRGRFPDAPVIVQVTIEPLRRDRSALDAGASEQLPYLGALPDAASDEWDDRTRTLEELMPRIRSAKLVVTIPSVANDEDLNELRDALYSGLSLIPGRDRIEFQRRAWLGREAEQTPWLNWALAGGLAVLCLLGLALVARGASNRLAKSLSSGTSEVGGDAAGPAMPRVAASSFGGANTQQAAPAKLAGDLRFNDPIRVREALREAITRLSADAAFPTLDDVIAIHQRIQSTSGAMGAFFELLPADRRQLLFRYGFGKAWLVAFADAGEIDIDAFEFVTRLAGADRKGVDREWQEALIAVWRLDDVMPEFLKTLPQDEAFALLAHMPPACSIPAARKAFPGAWGVLLDPSFKPKALARTRFGELARRAAAQKPWSDLELIERFRHERSLLGYLRVADVRDEREIYEAAGPESTLRRVRPPFYPLFRLPEQELKGVVGVASLEELAMALFNVSREERRHVEAVLTTKQRYLLVECLRRLDQEQPSRDQVGNAREGFGLRVAALERRRSFAAPGEAATQAATMNEENDGGSRAA